jgi:MYXO-CTERM domain-containing protein
VRKSLAAMGTAAALIFGPASAAVAQTGGGTETAQAETNEDDDSGKLGLLGLLGLGGLAGLARRDRNRGGGADYRRPGP